MSKEYYRNQTTDERTIEARHSIDPGFVHHRFAQTLLGPDVMGAIDSDMKQLPDMPDGLKQTRIDHIYTKYLLELCRLLEVQTLEALSRSHSPSVGSLFCSTDVYSSCPGIYEDQRGEIAWISDDDALPRIVLQFTCAKVRADTLKSRLRRGTTLSVIAHLTSIDEGTLAFEPIVMGFPLLSSEDPKITERLMWLAFEHYELFIEDIDEFNGVRKVPIPDSPEEMRTISEQNFKKCLAKILGDKPPNDWGGERSDYFSAHLHVRGKPLTAAFLLKGPARFGPMDMTYCGKRADQIYRLAQEPAQLLVLQHCHDVLPVVRAHLRAFAVSPVNPRRYCIIDGRDSVRLLNAHGLLEEARGRQ